MSMDCDPRDRQAVFVEDESVLCQKASNKDVEAFNALRVLHEPAVRKDVSKRLAGCGDSELQDVLERIFATAKNRLVICRSYSGQQGNCRFPPRARYDPAQGFSAFLSQVVESVTCEAHLCMQARDPRSEGNKEAFGELFRCYKEPLLAHLKCRMYEEPQNAAFEDLLGEVFLRALNNLRSGKYKLRYSFFQFLKNIARYVILENVSKPYLDQALKDFIPPEMRRIMTLELIRLAFLSAAKPHEALVLAFSALCRAPYELAGDARWTLPIRELVDTLEEAMHQRVCNSKDEVSVIEGLEDCLCKNYFHTCKPLRVEDLRTSLTSSFDHTRQERPKEEKRDPYAIGVSLDAVPHLEESAPQWSREDFIESWCMCAVEEVRSLFENSETPGGIAAGILEDNCEHVKTCDALELGLSLLKGTSRTQKKEDSHAVLWENIIAHICGCIICENRVLAHLILRSNLNLDRPLLSDPSHLPRGLKRYFEEVRGFSFRAAGSEPLERFPVQPMRQHITREALELAIASGAKPHQILAFGCVYLLGWRPRQLAEKNMMQRPLSALTEEFLGHFYAGCEVPYSEPDFRNHYRIPLLIHKLERPLAEIYREVEYRTLLASAAAKKMLFTGDSTLSDFIPDSTTKSIENTISDWCHKVARRIREMHQGTREPERYRA